MNQSLNDKVFVRRVLNGLRYLSRGDLRGLVQGVRTVWKGQPDELKRTALADVLRLFHPTPIPIAPLDVETDVIIPIYNGVEYLPQLFDSVLRNTHSPYRIIVIDDCSPDARVAPILTNVLQRRPNTLLLRNENNLGFVASVSRAAEYVRGDFVLLNSDVEVPSGWLERLMAPLLKNTKVASATPFTNAGTICSFPLINHDNPLPAGSTVDQVDAGFRHVTTDFPYIELPTGVGFCMAVSRAAWLKIGGFDTVFGRGYGEENDWCQRAKRAGFVNILVPNLFVYHKHGGSFASGDRAALQAHNLAILHQRHPNYDRDVRAFIECDPISGLREFLKIMVARYVSPGGVLITDHQLGGGANAYRQRLLTQWLNSGDPVLMCAPNLRNRTNYDLDFHSQSGVSHFTFDDLNHLRDVANYLAIGEIFINNLVDWPRPLEALACLTKIRQEINASISLPVHDFFSVCPSYNLLNKEGRYCGVPSIVDCRQCLPQNRFAHNPEAVGIDVWRERWQEFIAVAQNVFCFSDDSLSLVKRVYDLQAEQCHVRPHEVNTHGLARPLVSFGYGLHIGVVGAINHAKGAAIVSEIAGILQKENDGTKLSVIGPYDGWLRGKHVQVTGPYTRDQLPSLLTDLGINVCFLPSIWPETYSYVTSELIGLGMPLCVFDLGAPAERVRSYEKGCIIQTIDAAHALRAIRRLYESLRGQADGVIGPEGPASMRPLDPGFDRSTKSRGD